MYISARLVSSYRLKSEFGEYFPNETFNILYPEDVLQKGQDYFFEVYPLQDEEEMGVSYTTEEEFLATLTKVDDGVYEIYHADMLLWLIRCGHLDPYNGQYCIVS